jgi:D-alanine-D-alanine ligase
MRKLRVLVLVHHYLVPPADLTGQDPDTADWRTEHDVIATLRDELSTMSTCSGHGRSAGIRATDELKPHIAFNLLEAFHEIGTFDQNVVSYLELLRLSYTGCNRWDAVGARQGARRTAALSPSRARLRRGGTRPEDAITQADDVPAHRQVIDPGVDRHLQASVARTTRLKERVEFIHDSIATDAICEEYVEGRGLPAGNQRFQTLPVWEMSTAGSQHRTATERAQVERENTRSAWVSKPARPGLPMVRRIGSSTPAPRLSSAATEWLREDRPAPDAVAVLCSRPTPIRRSRARKTSRDQPTPPGCRIRAWQRILTTGMRWEPEKAG